MLHFCPNCTDRSVAWDSRCRRFLCLNAGCRCSFPVIEIKGLTEENILRSLGINLIDENAIQAWLEKVSNTESECGIREASLRLANTGSSPS